MTVATVTKKIGSGQVYTTLATWEAGKPANLTTAEKWTAGTFVGTFQQGEAVIGTGLTAGVFLDSDGSSYVTFGITTGNSASLVTLTGTTSGATCVVSAKTDTGIIWKGEINAASDAFSAAPPLAVSGSTSSSTCYTELTAGAGASFVDNVNVQTNALRFNASNGCAITGTGYSSSSISYQENFKCSRIQVAATGANAAALTENAGTGVLLDCDQCIFESKRTGTNTGDGQAYVRSGNIRNCLIVSRRASVGRVLELNGSSAYNCTVAVPSDLAAATLGIATANTCPVVENCAVFGATADVGGAGSITTSTTNYTSDTTPSTGFTGSIAYSTATFQNVTDATRDFRLVTGSGLLDVGTTDATNAATDIAGTARPQGSAYDVGCWELVVAAGGGAFPMPYYAMQRMR